MTGCRRAARCGSPGCPVRASRRWRCWSSRSCSKRVFPPTFSTATTCVTGSTPTSGFSMADRAENLRRLAHVATLLADSGPDRAGPGHQPARGAPRTGPQGAHRGRARLLRGVLRHPAGGLRAARSQGPLRQSAAGRDHPLHRYRQPVSAAEEPGPAAHPGPHAGRTGATGHRPAGKPGDERSRAGRPAGDRGRRRCCSTCAPSSPTPARPSERPRGTSDPTIS